MLGVRGRRHSEKSDKKSKEDVRSFLPGIFKSVVGAGAVELRQKHGSEGQTREYWGCFTQHETPYTVVGFCWGGCWLAHAGLSSMIPPSVLPNIQT